MAVLRGFLKDIALARVEKSLLSSWSLGLGRNFDVVGLAGMYQVNIHRGCKKRDIRLVNGPCGSLLFLDQ